MRSKGWKGTSAGERNERRVKTAAPSAHLDLRQEPDGSAIMNIRRLPGFMYHYKLATVLLTSGLFLVVYLLLHWGIMCTNLEAWRHVSTVVSPRWVLPLLRSERRARRRIPSYDTDPRARRGSPRVGGEYRVEMVRGRASEAGERG